jgi:hypothetical protein
MRSIRIEFGPDPVDAASAISDVQLAAALLAGAASTADSLAAAGPLRKIIKACSEFEAALARRPAINPAHMPSPATLKTIAAVEAVRARLPSDSTLAAIAAVEATRRPKG